MSTHTPSPHTQELEAADALSSTAVFYASPDAPLGTKLATMMAAAAAGERVRDEGGHALVILDDISPLSSEHWDCHCTAMFGTVLRRLVLQCNVWGIVLWCLGFEGSEAAASPTPAGVPRQRSIWRLWGCRGLRDGTQPTNTSVTQVPPPPAFPPLSLTHTKLLVTPRPCPLLTHLTHRHLGQACAGPC